MRASDADRDVVLQVLTEAYADGRLDREELDARTRRRPRRPGPSASCWRRWRVSSAPAPRRAGVRWSRAAELQQRAVESWRKDRREALWGLLSVSAIVWTIWLVTSRHRQLPVAGVRDAGRAAQPRPDPGAARGDRPRGAAPAGEEAAQGAREAARGGRVITLRTIRAHPSAVLLAGQLLAVLVYPFLGTSTAGRARARRGRDGAGAGRALRGAAHPGAGLDRGAARRAGPGLQPARDRVARQRRAAAGLGRCCTRRSTSTCRTG